jgi:hypothetical protein
LLTLFEHYNRIDWEQETSLSYERIWLRIQHLIGIDQNILRSKAASLNTYEILEQKNHIVVLFKIEFSNDVSVLDEMFCALGLKVNCKSLVLINENLSTKEWYSSIYNLFKSEFRMDK